MTNELLDRVRRVVALNLRQKPEHVGVDSTFDDLGMDSLDSMHLLFALESEFDVSIEDVDAKSIRSVREAAEGVAKLLASKAKNANITRR